MFGKFEINFPGNFETFKAVTKWTSCKTFEVNEIIPAKCILCSRTTNIR